jgi:predicted CXXCH cytochrome family protein
VWPNGDKQSPHRYVPHDSKNIPACSNCHKPHPVPPSAADIAAMANPNPQWCYTCHHTQVLTCGSCHPVPDACTGSESCGP